MPGPQKHLPDLPPIFLARMESLLGAEYPAFLAALEASPTSGLRVNSLKLNPEYFEKISPFRLEPIPWCPEGFLFEPGALSGKSPGKHPYHASGLYYLQEPSAMAASALLEPQPGELVLDLAAAPGGKSTHAASLMQNQGLLVANEIHPKRVWALAENLERWGARNAVIANETPERLAEQLGEIFDRVLVDAPCSGEGMFRRTPAARTEWNPNLVQGCSRRQQAILEKAASLVKPGGRLVYTTCTFNPEENEGSVAVFLNRHPEFEIIPSEPDLAFSPGRPDWLEGNGFKMVSKAVRLWPHLARCEGHFIAVLHRRRTSSPNEVNQAAPNKPPNEVKRVFEQFCEQIGLKPPVNLHLHFHGKYLYHLPPGLPDFGSLRLVHPGWWLGTWQTDRFVPSHALALGISREDIQRRIDLTQEEPASVSAYLCGEALNPDLLDQSKDADGWSLVTVDGFPLGWVKVVQGAAKNYYPRGLRWS